MCLYMVLTLPMVLLSGCAKSAAPQRVGWDACQVITEQDASKALGGDPGPGIGGSPTSVVNNYSCTYNYQDKHVILTIVPALGKETFARFKQEAISGDGAESLDGVGDGAYVHCGSDDCNVSFLKGEVLVNLGILGRASASIKQLTIELAKTAANRV